MAKSDKGEIRLESFESKMFVLHSRITKSQMELAFNHDIYLNCVSVMMKFDC